MVWRQYSTGVTVVLARPRRGACGASGASWAHLPWERVSVDAPCASCESWTCESWASPLARGVGFEMTDDVFHCSAPDPGAQFKRHRPSLNGSEPT